MTANTVTPQQRFDAHRKVKQLRADGQYTDALILEKATMWEGFPHNFTVDKVALATALLTSEYGSDNYYNIATTIYLIINQ